MINESIHLEDLTTLNVYAPKRRISKCLEQKMMYDQRRKRQTHGYSWRLQKPLLIDRINTQKFSKDAKVFNNTVSQGVLFVAQQKQIQTSTHEDAGSIPALAQ